MFVANQNTLILLPVEGGYLYRAPAPWVFGRAPHYLLNEGEKDRLVAAMTDAHPVRTAILFVVAAVLTTPVLAFAALAAGYRLGVLAIAGMVALTLVGLYLLFLLLSRATLRRLHRALPNATTTDRRISNRQLRDRIDATISPRALMAMTLTNGLAVALLLLSLAIGLADRDGVTPTTLLPVVPLVMLSLVTVQSGLRWYRRTRS